MRVIQKYEACDGKIFDSETECREHENSGKYSVILNNVRFYNNDLNLITPYFDKRKGQMSTYDTAYVVINKDADFSEVCELLDKLAKIKIECPKLCADKHMVLGIVVDPPYWVPYTQHVTEVEDMLQRMKTKEKILLETSFYT